MTGMTPTLTPGRWSSQLHPRSTDGRFDTKTQTAPEAELITGLPWHLRTNLAPTSEADNPLLVQYLSAQVENGDTAERWAEAINAYFDGDEGPRDTDEVYTIVRQTIGTPLHNGDVEHWHARTASWRDHALAALAADVD